MGRWPRKPRRSAEADDRPTPGTASRRSLIPWTAARYARWRCNRVAGNHRDPLDDDLVSRRWPRGFNFHAGEVDVDLRLLREEELEPPGSLADVLAPDASVEALGERTRRRFQEELVERFSQAPERDHLPEVGWCRLLMDFAVTYFDATVGSLSPRQLHELIFEIVPRKVSIHASEGRGLLEEARAFYAFLGREFGLAQAQDCLRVIDGDDAVKQLERALSNASNFGLAKSLVMGTGEFAAPRPKPASKRSSAKGKKDKRKAARKARKKNR